MLTNNIEEGNIVDFKEEALKVLGDEFKDYFKTDSEIIKERYFGRGQIESVKSASLKKSDTI